MATQAANHVRAGCADKWLVKLASVGDPCPATIATAQPTTQDGAGLLGENWRDVGLVELGSDLVALTRLRHQLDAVTVTMAASAGAFLAAHTHTATGAGHRPIHTARAVRDHFPAVAAALAAGDISLGRVHQIRRLAGLPTAARAQFEPAVLDVATQGTANDTGRAFDVILDAFHGDARRHCRQPPPGSGGRGRPQRRHPRPPTRTQTLTGHPRLHHPPATPQPTTAPGAGPRVRSVTFDRISRPVVPHDR